jgi:hypothetical protein
MLSREREMSSLLKEVPYVGRTASTWSSSVVVVRMALASQGIGPSCRLFQNDVKRMAEDIRRHGDDDDVVMTESMMIMTASPVPRER